MAELDAQTILKDLGVNLNSEESKRLLRALQQAVAPSVATSHQPVVLPRLSLYRVNCGPFYTTLYADNEIDAMVRACASLTMTWQLDSRITGLDNIPQLTVEEVPGLDGEA